MYFGKDIVDFFKRHNLYDEDTFKYLRTHTDMIDYRDEDLRICIGFGAYKDMNNRLLRFRICIPFPNDNKTKLIAIHELVHGIVAYKYLNKKFIDDIRMEVLAFLYEKIFIEESKDEELVKYGNYLDSLINSDSDESYKFALYARDYLLSEYSDDYDKMDRLSKKPVNKYKKHNK